MFITSLEDSLLDKVMDFLVAHEETSLFLMNNLLAHGPKLGEHHNSGNYKVILDGDKVIGVYCLTKRGNLLIQYPKMVDPKSVIHHCKRESHQLRGFIGEWDTVISLVEEYTNCNPSFKPTLHSKEILYRYLLNSDDDSLVHDPRVRLLQNEDLESWLPLDFAFSRDLGLPDDLDASQKRQDFSAKVQDQASWGLFDGDELVSIACLNSKGDRVGQVGGVFTVQDRRKKGYSKATMLHLLKDCMEIHQHRKSILFTGEKDIPAQKLYESIGYEKFGSFALILS